MWTNYNDTNIHFTIGDTRFHTLNLVYEKFQRTIPSHSHGNGSYEIHYIPEGYGRALIDGSYYEITPGTLYLTGPHITHAQTPHPENPMCEYCVYLKAEKKRRNHPDALTDREGTAALFEATPFWFGQAPGMGPFMEELFRELEEQKTGWEIQVEALLMQLVVRLVRCFEKSGRGKSAALVHSTDKTSVIIEEYFLYQYKNLSLEDLAGRLGLGTRQTERLLLKHYGKTFLQKKAEARMSAAAILLSDTNRSITSVAEALGYSSIEHFSSAFKRHYHQSPRQYRKQGAYHSFPPSGPDGL